MSASAQAMPITAGAAAAATPKALSSGPKASAKRAQIVQAAIEIVNAKSFAQATMTEIAGSLGLRDAALYYYFPDKQSLVYAGHVQSLERFEALLQEAEAGGGTGFATLHRFVRRMLEDSEQNGPQLYFGDHSYLEDAKRAAIDDWAARLTATLERFVAQGVADGSIVACEPRLVVQLLLGMLIWLAKWTPNVEHLTVERLLAAIEASSLNGLRAGS